MTRPGELKFANGVFNNIFLDLNDILWEKSHSRIYLILEFAPRGEMYKSLQKQPKQRSVQSQYIFVNSEHPSQSNVIFGSQAQAKVKSRDYVG